MGKGGKMVAADEAAELLLQSEQYAPFLAEGFDAACFASRSLTQTHSTAQAQTEALQAGVSALDGALRQLVLRHQDDLIAQTARLTDAESAVQRIGLSVRSLQMVAARVRAEVAEPYAQIAERTRQLRNLQATVDLLRHIIHRLKLVQKLRAQMAAADGVGARRTRGGCVRLGKQPCGDATAVLFKPAPTNQVLHLAADAPSHGSTFRMQAAAVHLLHSTCRSPSPCTQAS